MNSYETGHSNTESNNEPTGWESLEVFSDQEGSPEVSALMDRFGVSESTAQFIHDKLGDDIHAGGAGFSEDHAGEAAGFPKGMLRDVYDDIQKKLADSSSYSSRSMMLSNKVMHEGDYGKGEATLSLDEAKAGLYGLSNEDALRSAIYATSIGADETVEPIFGGTERISASSGSEESIALAKMFVKSRGNNDILTIESVSERGPSVQAEDGSWQNGEITDGRVTVRPATIDEIRAIQAGNFGRRYF